MPLPLDGNEGTEYPEAARTPMKPAKVMMATRSASILRDFLRGWCISQQWPGGEGGGGGVTVGDSKSV